MVVGPVVAARYVPVAEVGYLLLGISVLNVCGTAANPLNSVLLSKISMMLAQGRESESRECASHLLSAALPLGLFSCVQLLIFTDVFVLALVGPRFMAGIPVIRILAAAIPFFLAYTSLRSLVDAASIKPYNAGNTAIALALFCLLLALEVWFVPRTWLIEAFAVALLLAMVLLAILTTHSAQTLFQLRVQWTPLAMSSAGALVLGGLSLGVRAVEGFTTNVAAGLLIATTSSVLFGAYLFVIKSPWLMFLCRTLSTRKEREYRAASAPLEAAGDD